MSGSAASDILVRAGRARIAARLDAVETVVGAVCESEPLFEAERVVAETMPDPVVRGLGAALVACGARRGILLVRSDWPAARGALERAVRGTAVEVHTVEPYFPADELAAIEAGAAGARVVGARELVELDTAVRGKRVTTRWITIAGAVAEPRIVAVARGSRIDAVISDPLIPDWIAIDGALRGRILDRDDVVDETTPGLLVLPKDHSLIRRRRHSLADELLRARSACIECHVCTDACPHALAGAPIAPHLALRSLAHRRGFADAAACSGCGICDLVCPAGLHPRGLLLALRAESGALLEHPAAPHPDRLGRRLGIQLIAERLGLAAYSRPTS
jgi:Na+-translocating ferredoxin:NAD+ oxidoreductase RnfC subunit